MTHTAMTNRIESLLTSYSTWIRDRTSVRQGDGYVEITTPFLDRHNDCLQIYVTRRNGKFVLSDGGYLLDDLELSGCEMNTARRRAMLTATLNGFGVRENGRALEVTASDIDFPLSTHNLVQAMLAVNDMFYTVSPRSMNVFRDEVTNWLTHFNVRYERDARFTGRSGYDHRFDFLIPKSRAGPERVLRTFSHPGRDTLHTMAFYSIDTKGIRDSDIRAYAILNDKGTISKAMMDAVRSYDVTPVLWSGREEVQEELAA